MTGWKNSQKKEQEVVIIARDLRIMDINTMYKVKFRIMIIRILGVFRFSFNGEKKELKSNQVKLKEYS